MAAIQRDRRSACKRRLPPRRIAEEALGMAKGHLDSLRELVQRRITVPGVAAAMTLGHASQLEVSDAMLFDTHAHLDQADFDADRDASSSEPRRASSDHRRRHDRRRQPQRASSWPRSTRACTRPSASSRTTSAEASPGDWAEIERLAAAPRRRRHRRDGPRPPLGLHAVRRSSRTTSTATCGWRSERDLPFIVHMRDCDADILAMLREARASAARCGASCTRSPATPRWPPSASSWACTSASREWSPTRSRRPCATARRPSPPTGCSSKPIRPYLSPEPVRGKRPNEPALSAHGGMPGAGPRPFARRTRRA